MNTTFQSLQGLIVQQKQKAELFVKNCWFYKTCKDISNVLQR
ncbi:MAG: hypothetical protein ACOQNV_01020 [Mycoplasmoidaceae bacterium]